MASVSIILKRADHGSGTGSGTSGDRR